MNTQQHPAQDHDTPAAGPGSGNAQDAYNGAFPTPQDPPIMACTGLAQSATTGPLAPATGPPAFTSIGLTASGSESGPVGAENCGHTTCVEACELSAKGLSETAPVDPHEVRTRLAVHGAVHGLELDTGTGVVFIPQHALPDLRRRLYLAQQRFTAMSGPIPGKRRRRPTSAR